MDCVSHILRRYLYSWMGAECILIFIIFLETGGNLIVTINSVSQIYLLSLTMYVYMHKVACSLVFQALESSDALSLGLSSLIIKLHHIALSSFLLSFQTIVAHNILLQPCKVKDESTSIALLSPPCDPSFVIHKRKFPSCSYVRMFLETRCIVLVLNIATYFTTGI